MPALEPTPGDDYERKVFQAFVEGGRLKAIPVKLKKRQVLLRHMVHTFGTERVYREAEVNAVLGGFHEDFATPTAGTCRDGASRSVPGRIRLA